MGEDRFHSVDPALWNKEDAARWLCFVSNEFVRMRDWKSWIESGLFAIAIRLEQVKVLASASGNSPEHLDARFKAAHRLLVAGWNSAVL